MTAMNEHVTTIVKSKEGEELVDVKLFVRPNSGATGEDIARELAAAVSARRSNQLPTEKSSPERVPLVDLKEVFPDLTA